MITLTGLLDKKYIYGLVIQIRCNCNGQIFTKLSIEGIKLQGFLHIKTSNSGKNIFLNSRK